MFVRYKDTVINLNSVIKFYPEQETEYYIKFDMIDGNRKIFHFRTREERNDAFEYIISCLSEGDRFAWL